MLETQDDLSVWDDFQVEGKCPVLATAKQALLNHHIKTISFCRYRPEMVTELTTSIYHASEEIYVPIEDFLIELNGEPCRVRKLAFEDWAVTSPAYRLKAFV